MKDFMFIRIMFESNVIQEHKRTQVFLEYCKDLLFKKKAFTMKGLVHVDYIAGMSIMIFLLAVVAIASNTFLTSTTSEKDISVLSAQALGMLSIAEREHVFSGQKNISRIGIYTQAYRVTVIVNNTQPYLVNQTGPLVNLINEKIVVNYTALGFSSINVNSTTVYNENGIMLPYNIDGDTIIFNTDINASTHKIFTVYFDDDSNFTASSSAISGINNLTERIVMLQETPVIQYKKLLQLNETVYDYTKNITGVQNFRLTLLDIKTQTEFFSYGGLTPRKGNIISFQRYMLYQNSSAGVNRGRMRVQVW